MYSNGEENDKRTQDVGEVNFTMQDSEENAQNQMNQNPASQNANVQGQAAQNANMQGQASQNANVQGQASQNQTPWQHAQESNSWQSGAAGNGYNRNQSQPGQTDAAGGYGSVRPHVNPQMNRGGSYGNSQPNPGNGQQPHTDYAPWQQPQASFEHQENRKNRKKTHHPLLKKAAGITAAALLFGAVAGGTFAGINLISDGISSKYATEETEISKAETLPAPTEAKPENGGSNAVTAIPAVTNDVSAIVEQAMPSVVAINSVTEIQTQNWFGQTQIYEGKGSGSGIIAGESDSELLIVTNNHVVEGAKTLQVIFTDNETVEANVKGTDSENDLAVIAVPLDKIGDSTKSKIAVATLGDSDALKVGQGVIAIGNALGYGQSVTVGYVSALDREVKTDEMTTRNLLQTDAAINPGNSGGALLNMKGEVVGINSAKYSSTEVEGMGYAIPISKVQDIIDELMTKKTRVQVEEANQGYLGIQGTDIDQNAATLYGMPQGVFVYKITEDGAAASSELKEKDIITKFDGQSIRSMQELKDMLTYYAGGDTIQLTVQSLVDGKYVERQVEITLGTKPAEAPVNQ